MQLSYSALGIFKDCSRCFWLDRNKKLTRPRGIFSSMPGGVDGIIKEQLEKYRGQLPPYMAGFPQLDGFQLYTGADLKFMRNWKTNPLKMTDVKGNIIVANTITNNTSFPQNFRRAKAYPANPLITATQTDVEAAIKALSRISERKRPLSNSRTCL